MSCARIVLREPQRAFVPFRWQAALKAAAPPPPPDALLARVYANSPMVRVAHCQGHWVIALDDAACCAVLSRHALRMTPFNMDAALAVVVAGERADPYRQPREVAQASIAPIRVFTPPLFLLMTTAVGASNDWRDVTVPAQYLYYQYRTILQLMVNIDYVGGFRTLQGIDEPAWVSETDVDRAHALYHDECEQLALALDEDIAQLAAAATSDAGTKEQHDKLEALRAGITERNRLPDGLFPFLHADTRVRIAERRKSHAAQLAVRERRQAAWDAQMEKLFVQHAKLAQIYASELHKQWAATRDTADLELFTLRMINIVEMMLMAVMDVPLNLRAGMQTPISLPTGDEYTSADAVAQCDVLAARIAAAALRQRASDPPPADDEQRIFPAVVPDPLLAAVANAADYMRVLTCVVDAWKAPPPPPSEPPAP
jgi:hypothetical protein